MNSQGLSLVSRGARYQMWIATLLVGLLPALVICFLALTFFLPEGTFSLVTKLIIGGTAFILAVSGYAILLAYPRNIIKLREYLREIAEGELPEKVALDQSEDDIRAIETYLNQVISGLRSKIQMLDQQLQQSRVMQSTIATQQRELLEAEQQRIMIQSMGAMCHHIAQPLTVLSANLYFLRQQVPTPAALEQLAECERALADVSGILEKMRQVKAYRTVPYRTYAANTPLGPDCAILNIETVPAAPIP
ncbi:MAG: hypothetical protein NTY53_14440 [Kiritimatiellaeota bacterium]|nr:hypothetical protein [Kiritimatiellota bacterium]